jgi:hypothetical protein
MALRNDSRLEAGTVATANRGIKHSRSGNYRADVFPNLGVWVSCGAIVGMIFVIISRSPGSLPVRIASSAALGAILGTFIGLSRGIWHVGHTSSSPASVSAANRLWDPWLDRGHDVDDIPPASDEANSARVELVSDSDMISGLSAKRARVRPRILSLETGEAIRLEDEIGRLFQEGHDE